MIDLCGEHGPVFVYNAGFERNGDARISPHASPNSRPALEAIIDRVVDLLPIARNRYYHPSQQGSWSIKAVLPAAIPELSYDQLEGVQDGAMAVSAFMEAIAPATRPRGNWKSKTSSFPIVGSTPSPWCGSINFQRH